MAVSTGPEEGTGGNERGSFLHTGSEAPVCGRCGGLLVQDFFTDLLSSTGGFEGAIARCVQCGEVVDPVIQQNRQLQQTAGTVRNIKTPSALFDSRFSI